MRLELLERRPLLGDQAPAVPLFGEFVGEVKADAFTALYAAS